MDLRALQSYVHLAQTLHFSQTAEALFITPSTLSRQIQRLEDEVGSPLFLRNNRSVKLTAAGEVFLSFASNTLLQWQDTQQQIQSEQTQLRGELSLFCSVTAAQSHLPTLLNQYRTLHPQVELKLVTGDPALSVDKVQQQQADVAICIHSPQWPPGLLFKTLDQVPLVLIAPKRLKLQRMTDIDWREHQVIMPEKGPSRRIVHHWFAEHNIRPNIYAQVGGNEAIVSMVNLGLGIGFVPSIVIEYSAMRAQLQVINVNDLEPYHLGLGCIQSRSEEPMIKAMFDLIN